MASNQAHNHAEDLSATLAKNLPEEDDEDHVRISHLAFAKQSDLKSSESYGAFSERDNKQDGITDTSNPVHALQDHLEARVDMRGESFPASAEITKPGQAKRQATRKKRGHEPLSRAATLHLIDRLAKLGPSAILIMVSGALYFAASFFVVAPMLTALWAGMALVSGGRLLLHNRAFLAGDKKIASRPLRFRAYHTMNLLIFSTALATVLPLLGGYADQLGQSHLMVNVMLFVAVLSGLLQLPHARASLAILLPIVISVLCFGEQNLLMSPSLILFTSLGGLAILAMFMLIGSLLKKRARRRYPRTVYKPGFERRSFKHFRRKALPSSFTARHAIHDKSVSVA